MSKFMVDVGGMYSVGKTTVINYFLKGLPQPEKVTESKYCNITHNDRSGIKKVVLGNCQIIVGNEWVTDKNGTIIYEKVVGPKTNPFLSEFVFLYQAVVRHLAINDICQNFPFESMVINDLSFWDSFKMFGPTFYKLNKGVRGKSFDEKMNKHDLESIKKVLNIDLKKYNGRTKQEILEHFYSNPHLVVGLTKKEISLEDLKPDLYLILIVDPLECVLRVTHRNRKDFKELAEDDIRYPTLLKKNAEKFYKKNKNWNIRLLDTTKVSRRAVHKIFSDEIFKSFRNPGLAKKIQIS